jgi:DNA primase
MTVMATEDHRWLLLERMRRPNKKGARSGEHNGYEMRTSERMTGQLCIGDTLRSLKAHPLDGMMDPVKVPFAVAQGFVFGDGTHGIDDRPASLTVYDQEKDRAILPYFAAHEVRQVEKNGGPALEIYGLPRTWKDAPVLEESRSFLVSWLAGYFAADGCVSENGQARVSSANRDSLKIVRSIAAICGAGYGPLTKVMREGFKGRDPSALYGVNLRLIDLPKWFFQIGSHEARAIAARAKKIHEDFSWKVERVTSTFHRKQVFCAVVHGAQAFGLSNGLMTGGCM